MRRAILTVFSTIAGLVLLLTFKTSSGTTAPVLGATGSSSAATVPSTPSSSSTSSSSAAAAGSSSGSAGSGSSGSGSKTVTGSSVDTRYGPVQVRITVVNGKVTASEAIDYPQSSGRDQEINSYAIPTLNQEAASAGTAQIDMVSGATYTSEGYISSLQSALDKL